jgi:acetyl-CoA acyltransferase
VGLGHPVACSGARILVTLIHELRRRGGGYGVATLCAGGGMSLATVVEVLAP